MASYDSTSFDSMFAAVKQLPGAWGPRREQPEWDRDFGGNADIQEHFGHRTDKAHEWMAFALGFSSVILEGFETKKALLEFGSEMRTVVQKGKKQFDN